MDIKVKGELPELSKDEINHLLNNFKDDELILHHLPVDKFEFVGMGIGVFNDVTELEIQSVMKDAMLNISQVKPREFLDFMDQQMNDYMRRNDVEVGITDLIYSEIRDLTELSLSDTGDIAHLKSIRPTDTKLSPYEQVYQPTDTRQSIVSTCPYSSPCRQQSSETAT